MFSFEQKFPFFSAKGGVKGMSFSDFFCTFGMSCFDLCLF